MALLTSLQDQTIRTYFLIALGADFEQRLRTMITDRLAPTATFRTFVIPGGSPTLLGGLATQISSGLKLETWLARMGSGDSGWTVGLQGTRRLSASQSFTRPPYQ